MLTQTELNEARRQKCLDKLINYNGQILTLAAYLARYPTERKHAYVQEYSDREVCLEHKKLDHPKTHYCVWHTQNGHETGIEIPKLVYDQVNAPE